MLMQSHFYSSVTSKPMAITIHFACNSDDDAHTKSLNREVDSRYSSITSQDSRGREDFSGDTPKRKPSMLVHRMLHINSISSQDEDSVHHPSVSLREVSIGVDENDQMIAGNCYKMTENAAEGGESDDVFRLVHDDSSESLTNFHFPKPKSSTMGRPRELVASMSVLDLSQLENKNSITLRRQQLPSERKPIRAARSTVYHCIDETGSSERTRSEEIIHFKAMETVKSFQSKETDIKRRRDAMRRRSTRDLEHSTCLIRMYTIASIEEETVGWSEVEEYTSMLTILD